MLRILDQYSKPKIKMNSCTQDCIFVFGGVSFDEMCKFSQNHCKQDAVDFVQAYYCIFNASFISLILVGIPVFYLLFKTLNVIAQEFLSPCVNEFILEFKMSPTLAGVTFLAFANGAPDVMTAIVAGSSSSDSTALIPFGSIFGACLFSVAFILPAVILMQPKQSLKMPKSTLILPLSFYIMSILFIIGVTTLYGKMNIIFASVLLFMYVIYILFILRKQRLNRKNGKLNKSSSVNVIKSVQDRSQFTGYKSENSQILTMAHKQTVKVEQLGSILIHEYQDEMLDTYQSQQIMIDSEQKIKQVPKQTNYFDKLGEYVQFIVTFILKRLIPFYRLDQWNPLDAVTSLIASPFIIACTLKFKYMFDTFVGPLPIFFFVCIPSLILLVYVAYCIVRCKKPYYIRPFTIYSFLVSVCTLTIACFVLVNFMELVQILTDINPVFLGLTILSWVNSIGDYLTITHFAKKGNYQTAIAGIFSGQLFNFLIGFGISLAIQSIGGEYQYKIFSFQGDAYSKISDSIVMAAIVGGLVYLVYMFVTAIRFGGRLSSKDAKFSFWYYVGFLVIACALAMMTDFFNQILCEVQMIYP